MYYKVFLRPRLFRSTKEAVSVGLGRDVYWQYTWLVIVPRQWKPQTLQRAYPESTWTHADNVKVWYLRFKYFCTQSRVWLSFSAFSEYEEYVLLAFWIMLKCCRGRGYAEGGGLLVIGRWGQSIENWKLSCDIFLYLYLLGSRRRRWMNEIVTVLRFLKGIAMRAAKCGQRFWLWVEFIWEFIMGKQWAFWSVLGNF